MQPFLFDPDRPDHSARVGFAHNALERLSEKRSAHCVSDAIGEARARFLAIGQGRVLLPDGQGPVDPWLTADQAALFAPRHDDTVLLGFDHDGAPRLAMPVEADADHPPDGFVLPDFRSTYVAGLLSEADLGVLAQAGALIAWHRSHRFCSRCGHESDIADGGYKRICPSCGGMHFPRTDPVVIMLALSPDNERCLLGRSPHFPQGVYSCLAGFVEPGETLENAVRRETFEEAGIRIGTVAYHASQPWPFPYTLMIGMYGIAKNDDVIIDEELEDARWFPRSEVRAMVDGSHPDGITMPPPGAIAWRIIEDWVTGATA
jgi:NAD+ diphosphatase